ncbi:MAG: heavy metal-binding domain-containing protein [Thermoplasmata archaeon]
MSAPSGLQGSNPNADDPVESANPFVPPSDILVVTSPYISGYRVTKVIGATFGLIVRSRGLGQNIGAYFRSWAGGEIRVYTQLLEQVRHQAIERLAAHAKSLGANAVISVGFDTSEMGGSMTEVLAYGTAVIAEQDPTPAAPVALR